MTAPAVTVPQLEGWIRAFAALVAEQKGFMTELDSAIGDADHGINMDRGMRAVVEKLDSTRPATADELFKLVGVDLPRVLAGADASAGPAGRSTARSSCASAARRGRPPSCLPTTSPRRSGPG